MEGGVLIVDLVALIVDAKDVVVGVGGTLSV